MNFAVNLIFFNLGRNSIVVPGHRKIYGVGTKIGEGHCLEGHCSLFKGGHFPLLFLSFPCLLCIVKIAYVACKLQIEKKFFYVGTYLAYLIY